MRILYIADPPTSTNVSLEMTVIPNKLAKSSDGNVNFPKFFTTSTFFLAAPPPPLPPAHPPPLPSPMHGLILRTTSQTKTIMSSSTPAGSSTCKRGMGTTANKCCTFSEKTEVGKTCSSANRGRTHPQVPQKMSISCSSCCQPLSFLRRCSACFPPFPYSFAK